MNCLKSIHACAVNKQIYLIEQLSLSFTPLFQFYQFLGNPKLAIFGTFHDLKVFGNMMISIDWKILETVSLVSTEMGDHFSGLESGRMGSLLGNYS